MNAANCIGIYLSAKARNCRELALSATIINLKNLSYSNISIILGAKRYAFEHFRNVVHESEEYLQLPYIELKNILESQLLNTAGEGEILETITKWVDYKPNERLGNLTALVSEIDIWQVLQFPSIQELVFSLFFFCLRYQRKNC